MPKPHPSVMIAIVKPTPLAQRQETIMPRYMVERTFPEGLNLPVNEDGAGACTTIIGRNAEGSVTWVQSFVSADKRQTFCIYDAPHRKRSVRPRRRAHCRSTGSRKSGCSTLIFIIDGTCHADGRPRTCSLQARGEWPAMATSPLSGCRNWPAAGFIDGEIGFCGSAEVCCARSVAPEADQIAELSKRRQSASSSCSSAPRADMVL